MGIGIHSGQAIVGNAGSDRQLKYGPRGSAVNLTSRVESATKRLGVTIAMTKAVRERVDQHMVVRRLCRARLAGVTDAIDIFELVSTRQANLEGSMTDRLWRYEEALRSFERGDLQTAEKILAAISADKYGKVDLPTQWLSAAVQSEVDHGGIIDLAT
jgi:adenylate cyclase